MISAVCPKCQAVFQLGDEFGGVTVQCSVCSTEFVVSGDVAAAAPENIGVVCPGCRTTHQVPAGARGAEAECMVCQISFRIPEMGDQGIAVGPLPPPAPMPAAPPVPPSPFASAAAPPAPAPGGIASSGGIDYKNTSTIKLTRSSLFGAAGKPGATPPASLRPPPPPAPAPAPVPAAAAPVPAAAPPAPASSKSTASGRIPGGKKFTTGARASTNTGKLAGGSALAREAAASGAGMGTMVSSSPPASYVSSPEVASDKKGGATALDLVLALIPVLLAPACVLLLPNKGLAAGVCGGVGLLCWLGILLHSMSMRNK